MNAIEVMKNTQKLTGGVGGVLNRFFQPDDGRIMMFDDDDEF